MANDEAIRPYERIFELAYDSVRVDTNDPNQTYLFFPLKRLRKITADTPLPPKRKNERDCLTVAMNDASPSTEPAPKMTFKGFKVGDSHARLTIPVLINPATSKYIIPPNVSLKSFDDVEKWLIEFSKKFELMPSEDANVMLFKTVSAVDAPGAKSVKPKMTYELEGLNVQAWTSPLDARSFFAIFAPPSIPLVVLQAHLKGLESSLGQESCGAAPKKSPVDAASETSLAKFLLTTPDSTVAESSAALINLCSQVSLAKADLDDGKRFIMVSGAVRKCGPNIAAHEGVKDSPLGAAVAAKKYELVKLLLDHGADISARDAELRTPLHIAAGQGDIRALQLLLDCRETRLSGPLNLNVVDSTFRTPLMYAAEARSLDAVRLLLEYGANATARDNQNESALHKLVAGGFDQTIAAELVAAGCSPVALSNFGMTASTYAASRLVVYNMPPAEKLLENVPIMDRQLDMSFSSARHRSSQGAITMDVSLVANRPSFVFQYGLTIHAKSETYIHLRPSIAWVAPHCKCEGPALRRLPPDRDVHGLLQLQPDVLAAESLQLGQSEDGNLWEPTKKTWLVRTFFADTVEPNLRVVMFKEFDQTKPPQIAFFASEWVAKDEILGYDKPKSFHLVQNVLKDHLFNEYRC
ncbi:hypothetical protein BV898_05442 [Hypsibius exemplaris]|uniref:Uncharacterized protein n=1 Tax=Hypsibius exemplaris TaxID=2072580 RepID=A0A1W0WZJ1_HYPEX|nr:hypothetical protein BV898_05442 [Hypsibius exemplaris]